MKAIINAKTSCGSSFIGITSPVSIGVCYHSWRGRGIKKETKDRGMFEIPENSFDSLPMWYSGIMDKLIDFFNSKRIIKMGKSKVLEDANNTTV